MKRALILSCSFLFAVAGCGREEPQPPTPGGQSGDDGDVNPDKGGPPDVPGPPQDPCDRVHTPLALDAATPFGASALELVSNIAPTSDSPLFWVAYDDIADVSFTPGPGETSITLGIEPRAGETATLTTAQPRFENTQCPDDMLRVPVHVTLRSADGALDTGSDSVLLFTSATTAELLAGFATDALGGSFAFDRLGDPAERYIATGIRLEAQLWVGGSRGALYPNIEQAPPTPPPSPGGALQGVPGPTPPPPASAPVTPTPGFISAPIVPERWREIAVWPRLEACAGDGRGSAYAYAADERVIGTSLSEIVDAVNAQGPFTVSLGDQTASLLFEAEVPAGLSCAAPMPFSTELASRSLTFDVRAALRSEDAGDSALADLDTTSVFQITATSAADGTLAELRWARRDLPYAQSRSAFEAATGLTLDAPAEYEQLWWSWHASDMRADGDTWSPRGALVVSSLNSEQAAEIARIQAQGGPGVGFSIDETTKFPVLPGDTLLDAEIVP